MSSARRVSIIQSASSAARVRSIPRTGATSCWNLPSSCESLNPPASGLPAPWFLAHDTLVHAGVYGVLSQTVYFALRQGHHRSPRTAALMSTLFASLYGLSDEVHQMFTPSRVADLWDWVADTAGAACIFLLTLLPSRHEPER